MRTDSKGDSERPTNAEGCEEARTGWRGATGTKCAALPICTRTRTEDIGEGDRPAVGLLTLLQSGLGGCPGRGGATVSDPRPMGNGEGLRGPGITGGAAGKPRSGPPAGNAGPRGAAPKVSAPCSSQGGGVRPRTVSWPPAGCAGGLGNGG